MPLADIVESGVIPLRAIEEVVQLGPHVLNLTNERCEGTPSVDREITDDKLTRAPMLGQEETTDFTPSGFDQCSLNLTSDITGQDQLEHRSAQSRSGRETLLLLVGKPAVPPPNRLRQLGSEQRKLAECQKEP